MVHNKFLYQKFGVEGGGELNTVIPKRLMCGCIFSWLAVAGSLF